MKEEEPGGGRLEKEEKMEKGGGGVCESEGRGCGCCHLWAQVPPDPSSWQAAYLQIMPLSPANTVQYAVFLKQRQTPQHKFVPIHQPQPLKQLPKLD